jgi:hypothetical protein
MDIKSPAFENNTQIPSKYTCNGENINPPLIFTEVPSNAQGLALIVDDPDAPSGTWTHWIVWNIPPKTTQIDEDSTPMESIEGINSSRRPGYGGPCPPFGTHRYFFRLYALDTKLDLPPQTTLEKLEMSLNGHVLAQAELIGLYSRI